MENDEQLAPLNRGEWESLIFAANGSIRPLIFRLARHHGAVEASEPGQCPLCGPEARRPVAKLPSEQFTLEAAF